MLDNIRIDCWWYLLFVISAVMMMMMMTSTVEKIYTIRRIDLYDTGRRQTKSLEYTLFVATFIWQSHYD